jgi:hypothetical protein
VRSQSDKLYGLGGEGGAEEGGVGGESFATHRQQYSDWRPRLKRGGTDANQRSPLKGRADERTFVLSDEGLARATRCGE